MNGLTYYMQEDRYTRSLKTNFMVFQGYWFTNLLAMDSAHAGGLSGTRVGQDAV